MGLVIFVIIWISIWVPLYQRWGEANGVWACSLSAGAAFVIYGILKGIYNVCSLFVNPSSNVHADHPYGTPGSSHRTGQGGRADVIREGMVHVYCTLALVDGPLDRGEFALIANVVKTLDSFSNEMDMLSPTEFAERFRRTPEKAAAKLSQFRDIMSENGQLSLISKTLDCLVTLALIDGPLNAEEIRLLKLFRRALGTSSPEYQRHVLRSNSRSKESGQSKSNAFNSQVNGALNEYAEILGVPIGSDRNMILAAYKSLVRQYHPDKVATMGPKVREAAEQEMKRINHAKDELLRALNN